MVTIPLTLSSIGDPDGTRTVTSIVVLLVAIGLALILLAVWIFRRTRPDPELLAPLEVMGDRSWRRGEPVWQRRRLDEVRPRGARPRAPSAAPPELDESFDAGPTASGFDDLRPGSAPAGHSAEEPADTADRSADAGDADVEVAEAERPVRPSDATPSGVVGPVLVEFQDDDFDPDVLAAAREQLERELADSRAERSGGAPDDGDRPA